MPHNFFNAEEQKQIIAAIKSAEQNTSGEIRLHIDKYCKESVLDRATYWFEKLNMHRTKLRNGVLFYLATNDKKIAILGDAGINQKVPSDFWDEIKNQILADFKNGSFADGICKGIIASGEQLKTHFPYKSDDVNELTDDISFGKK
ncbi:MAG: TPM domain-containing protein [Marinilabiliaceae bacterium]|nr:TPM domain-containing protein [Marinilabiliaceae bacterium]